VRACVCVYKCGACVCVFVYKRGVCVVCVYIKCTELMFYCTEKDKCLSDPCKHGGWCTIVKQGSIRCYCEPGFVGDHCETGMLD